MICFINQTLFSATGLEPGNISNHISCLNKGREVSFPLFSACRDISAESGTALKQLNKLIRRYNSYNSRGADCYLEQVKH